MVFGPWVYVAALGLAVGHLVVVLYATSRRSSADSPDVSEDDAPSGVVECGRCGARNGREYRFCRECVSELPGAAGVVERGATPSGRSIR